VEALAEDAGDGGGKEAAAESRSATMLSNRRALRIVNAWYVVVAVVVMVLLYSCSGVFEVLRVLVLKSRRWNRLSGGLWW